MFYLAWNPRFRDYLMAANKGPQRDLPASDGSQDKRPWIRCFSCKKLRPCYRGPLLKVVDTEAGPFEHYRWTCQPCMDAWVFAALAHPD